MVHTLSITGRVDYDNTEVVARADLPDGSFEDSTPIATLRGNWHNKVLYPSNIFGI